MKLGTWQNVKTYSNAALGVPLNWRRTKRLYKRHTRVMWRNGSNKSLRTMERVLCIPKGKRKPWRLNHNRR